MTAVTLQNFSCNILLCYSGSLILISVFHKIKVIVEIALVILSNMLV